MPSATREDYIIVASGPSNYAPFLSGWKDFRDHLRQIIPGQPRWAETMQGQRKGEVQGWCRLDRKTDADAAYTWYMRQRGVLVHVFKTSRTSGDFHLLKCNCSPHFPDVSDRGHSPHRSGVEAGGVNRYIAGISNTPMTPQYVTPATPAYSYSLYMQQPAAYAAMPLPTYAMPTMIPQMPVYASLNGAIPVNIQGGAVLTEARGIFMSNLSYKATQKELLALVNQVASPIEFKYFKDPRTGNFKGTATAKFATKEEAQAAVARLNQTVHMGMAINVRLDSERTAVGQVQAPLIVNGSTYAGHT